MRRVSMTTRNELVVAVADRYARSDRLARSRILDEFVAVTGHHRKHAMRLLRGSDRQTDQPAQRRSRVYDAAMREALIVLWEASGSVRTRAKPGDARCRPGSAYAALRMASTLLARRR